MLAEILKGNPRMIALNKADLADSASTKNGWITLKVRMCRRSPLTP
jgi:ribosome biogenesis GTPase A